MVANPNQRKNPVIRVVGSVASGNAGRGYRKVPSWWRDFCVSATPLLKPNQQIMNTNINESSDVNKNILLKSYLVGSVPTLLLIWFISSALEESFFLVLLIAGGIYFGWLAYKAIITSITFHLFLKSDMVQSYVNVFRTNSFPKPDNVDSDSLEPYLESLAMDPDNHPVNIVATTILSEFGHARSSGSMLALLRFRKVVLEALKRYQYTNR